jgi:hypothetical protein
VRILLVKNSVLSISSHFPEEGSLSLKAGSNTRQKSSIEHDISVISFVETKRIKCLICFKEQINGLNMHFV